jgi:hypothetical protein
VVAAECEDGLQVCGRRLLRMNPESPFLLSHQSTLWRRELLLECMRDGENAFEVCGHIALTPRGFQRERKPCMLRLTCVHTWSVEAAVTRARSRTGGYAQCRARYLTRSLDSRRMEWCTERGAWHTASPSAVRGPPLDPAGVRTTV